jgi:hypothetical protein
LRNPSITVCEGDGFRERLTHPAPFSSFHRMVMLGVHPEHWAVAVVNEDADFGERD